MVRHNGGSTSILFALMIPVLFLFIGGAVDITLAMNERSRLQTTLDAAVLASASLTQSGDPETVITDWVNAHISESRAAAINLSIDIESTSNLNARRVDIIASGQVPTSVLAIFGINAMPIEARTSAFERINNVEISLVLDVSSSMGGSRIADLRDASRDFVNIVLGGERSQTTSINLVPYGGTVRLDETFYRFVDPSEGVSEGDWLGCLEYEDEDVEALDLDLAAYAPTLDFWKWNSTNPWCPPVESEALFLTNDAEELHERIDAFELTDGTGTDHGVAWGFRSLHPDWRGDLNGAFADRPAPFDSETMKVLVVMTDGGITAQFRPLTYLEDQPTRSNGANEWQMYSRNAARDNFEAVCDAAKAEGIVVFTIAFRVNQAWMRDLMEDCASSESHYFDVSTGDLEEAFASIAGRIERLRITAPPE